MKCCAFKNKKSSLRCPHRAKDGTYTCGIHKRTIRLHTSVNTLLLSICPSNRMIELCKSYNARRIYRWWKSRIQKHTNYLNTHYSHQLIFGESDWSEIPYRLRVYIKDHDEWWNLYYIILHFKQQLNHSDMNGPSLTYPCSPYTRKPYSYQDIIRLCVLWMKLNLALHVSLNEFSKQRNKNIIIQCHKRLSTTRYNIDTTCRLIGQTICNLFYQTLRFQIMNKTDSQENYIGEWVSKYKPLTKFEIAFRKWNNLRPYIFDQYNNLMENPLKGYMKTILNEFSEEYT